MTIQQYIKDHSAYNLLDLAEQNGVLILIVEHGFMHHDALMIVGNLFQTIYIAKHLSVWRKEWEAAKCFGSYLHQYVEPFEGEKEVEQAGIHFANAWVLHLMKSRYKAK